MYKIVSKIDSYLTDMCTKWMKFTLLEETLTKKRWFWWVGGGLGGKCLVGKLNVFYCIKQWQNQRCVKSTISYGKNSRQSILSRFVKRQSIQYRIPVFLDVETTQCPSNRWSHRPDARLAHGVVWEWLRAGNGRPTGPHSTSGSPFSLTDHPFHLCYTSVYWRLSLRHFGQLFDFVSLALSFTKKNFF